MKHELNALFKCVEEFRKVDDEMPSQRMAITLLVAMHGDVTQKFLSEMTGLSISSINRHVAALSKVNPNNKKAGCDLVETTEDPTEPRRLICHLTSRGKRVVSTLTDNLSKCTMS